MSPKEYGWFGELPPPAASKLDAIAQGLKFYMPMRPCHWGHMAVRSVNGGCMECRRLGTLYGTGRRNYREERQAQLLQRRKEREKAAAIEYFNAKKVRTPAWADKVRIKEIHAEARNQGMVVDHIIPLRSDTVCGLHVENNLQLLPGLQNTLKGNRFDPEDFSYGKGCKHEKPNS